MKKWIITIPLALEFFFMLFITNMLAQEVPYGHVSTPFTIEEPIVPKTHRVQRNIQVQHYFDYLDSVLLKINDLYDRQLTEHLLIRHNPWIIDTLMGTDYYKMMEKDSFVYDQKKLLVLKKGQLLKIPDSTTILALKTLFKGTLIDINIPEFKLRIYNDTTLLHTFLIRVGQNRSKYLAMGNRITNLRTIHGSGSIEAHVKNPSYYNPTTGKRYLVTRRDDQRVTLMPQIPWIETKVNGIRNGQMIHPTTNPNTLGKAYSNGCIGTKEADAWVIYYYAPVGTRLQIRYELKIKDEQDDEILLKNIYGYSE